jgi:hypothetical protein
MLRNLDVFRMFPSIESADRCLAFLHRVLRGEFPCFHGTIKALRLPAAHLTALRFLRLVVPRLASFFSLLGGRVPPPRPGVDYPVSPTGILPRRRQDLSSSWRTQMSVCTCSSTPAGLRAPDHLGAAAWPPRRQRRRLPQGSFFRSSIAWLSDSLSTLRSAGYPDPTQDSLPAVGQTLLGGLSTRRVPMKGFRVASLHPHPPLPSFA